MEYSNDVALLCFDNASWRSNWYVCDLVVVETSDVDRSGCFHDQADIIAKNAAVGTTVNKSAIVGQPDAALGDIVHNIVLIYFNRVSSHGVSLTIDHQVSGVRGDGRINILLGLGKDSTDIAGRYTPFGSVCEQ